HLAPFFPGEGLALQNNGRPPEKALALPQTGPQPRQQFVETHVVGDGNGQFTAGAPAYPFEDQSFRRHIPSPSPSTGYTGPDVFSWRLASPCTLPFLPAAPPIGNTPRGCPGQWG